ncbi:hypothetical protein P9D60_20630 [Bacillus spizizenii]|nr:hypothetical protein [Bacillus spizizenii]MEC1599848.1 hypothetical protein [Bacillus spizizenii]MEC1643566.1 hypothetical protein [Bacillus spizizenii]
MFTAVVNGKTLDETDIKLLELEEAHKALRLLKSRTGRSLEEIFTREELDESAEQYKKWVAESNGEWKSTDVRFTFKGLKAEEFLKNLANITKDPFEALLFSPQHYVGEQIFDSNHNFLKNRVIEVAGGLPVEIFGKFGEEFSEVVPPNPEYPFRMVAKFYTRDDVHIMGCHHEFRDTEEGFEGTLAIYFPKAAEEARLHHQKHLCIEFRNMCWRALEIKNN